MDKKTPLIFAACFLLLAFCAEPVLAQKRGPSPRRSSADPLSDIAGKIAAAEEQEMLDEFPEMAPPKPKGVLKPSPFQPAAIALPRTGVILTVQPGDDGHHRKGVTWPAPRFTDNQNGTVTDNLTGLVWLRAPSSLKPVDWQAALAACNSLAAGKLAGLDDASRPGDWRLPNMRELLSLVDYAENSPALPAGHPFNLSETVDYWSSTTMLDAPRTPYRGPIVNAARSVNFADGRLADTEKTWEIGVWPVRCPRPGTPEAAAAATAPAPVPRTGQIASYAAGDDGDLQKGRPWPEPRFTDNNDGTVTDNLTGLVWLKDHKSLGMGSWEEALARCNELGDGKAGLSDGSQPGAWRLPNVRELHSLVDGSVRDPALPPGHLFFKPSPASHWTATPLPHKENSAWRIGIRDGGTGYSGNVGKDCIWPVRGGR